MTGSYCDRPLMWLCRGRDFSVAIERSNSQKKKKIDPRDLGRHTQSSSGDGRLVGSSIGMSDMLLLEKGNKACLGERDHT